MDTLLWRIIERSDLQSENSKEWRFHPVWVHFFVLKCCFLRYSSGAVVKPRRSCVVKKNGIS